MKTLAKTFGRAAYSSRHASFQVEAKLASWCQVQPDKFAAMRSVSALPKFAVRYKDGSVWSVL